MASYRNLDDIIMYTGTGGGTGPPGADGSNGVDGVNGVDGTDGSNGVDGSNGLDGSNGVDGADGATLKNQPIDLKNSVVVLKESAQTSFSSNVISLFNYYNDPYNSTFAGYIAEGKTETNERALTNDGAFF